MFTFPLICLLLPSLKDIRPGYVLCSAKEQCHVGRVFDAQIVVLDYKSIICPGKSLSLSFFLSFFISSVLIYLAMVIDIAMFDIGIFIAWSSVIRIHCGSSHSYRHGRGRP